MTEIKYTKKYLNAILLYLCFEVSFANTKVSPQPLWNSTDTDKLRQDLLLNYDKFAKPAQQGQKITVNIGLKLKHFELNEMKSTFTVYCYMKLRWQDNKLQWNASDYGEVKVLHLAEHEIWQPDIFLYNGLTSTPISFYSNTNFVVSPNGMVIWAPSAQFSVVCYFNLKYWPFDTQKCKLKFGSWTYDGYVLDLELFNTTQKINHPDFAVNNTEWAITETSQSINVKRYPCCKEPYPDLQIWFTLSRLSSSYSSIIITPAFVVMFLTLMKFWLPPQSGGKVIIDASTAIMVCLFLLYFTQKLPAMGDHTPHIVTFYSTCLYLVSFSMIESVVVIALTRTTHSDPLHWLIKMYMTGKFGQFLKLNDYINQSYVTPMKMTAEEMHDHHVTDTEYSSNDEYQIVRRSTSENSPSVQKDWILLAVAIDRVSFLVYSFIFFLLAIIYSL